VGKRFGQTHFLLCVEIPRQDPTRRSVLALRSRRGLYGSVDLPLVVALAPCGIGVVAANRGSRFGSGERTAAPPGRPVGRPPAGRNALTP